MRGIEAALRILAQDKGTGPFASESLRKLADRENMKSTDISLASSLIYIMLRRKELWEKVAGEFLTGKDKLPHEVLMSIAMGAGGLLELRRFSGGVLINGILEYLKASRDYRRYSGLVNAVLRKIGEGGPIMLERLKREDRPIYSGIPSWTLPAWLKTWSRAELNGICDMMLLPSYASLRVSPGKSEHLMNLLESSGIHAYPSELSKALRLNQSILPANTPGFTEGLCTIQSEGSMLTASLAGKFYKGGLVLDMCSGRGIKSGQILQECQAKIECWELSEKKSQNAKRELERLGLSERAVLKSGDAMSLEPDEVPSFVVVDAPCSCSGTWNRKPESKWRMDWKKFDGMTAFQKKILARALTLCQSGGYILYITCSLLKQENENVIAEVLAGHSDCVEVSNLIDWNGKCFKRGRPYGIYILPCDSWLDGFYCSLIMKR